MRVRTLLAGLSVLLVSFSYATAGFSMSFLRPTLSDYVRRSSEIAIVRIQKVERLVPKGGHNTSCGYVYNAVVHRNIKGTKKSFKFYSDIADNYLGKGYKYLVIAIPFSEPEKNFDAINTNMPNVCQGDEAIPYWVPGEEYREGYPLMVPLIHGKSKDWIFTAKYSLLFLSVFEVRKTVINKHCYAGVPLREALGLIAAAEHGNSATEEYLRGTYPRGKPYYYLADPCGWAPGK